MHAFPMEGKADEQAPTSIPLAWLFWYKLASHAAASTERSCPCLEQGHNARKSMPPPTAPQLTPLGLYPFLCWWTFKLLPCPGNPMLFDWIKVELVSKPNRPKFFWHLKGSSFPSTPCLDFLQPGRRWGASGIPLILAVSLSPLKLRRQLNLWGAPAWPYSGILMGRLG